MMVMMVVMMVMKMMIVGEGGLIHQPVIISLRNRKEFLMFLKSLTCSPTIARFSRSTPAARVSLVRNFLQKSLQIEKTKEEKLISTLSPALSWGEKVGPFGGEAKVGGMP